MEVDDDSIQSWRWRKFHRTRIVSRAILSVYLAVTIPLRYAFIPYYEIDFQLYGVYIVLDLVSSFFFLVDSISIFRNFQKARVTPTENEAFIEHPTSISERQRKLRQSQAKLVAGGISSLPLEYVTILFQSTKDFTVYLIVNKFIVVLYLPGHIEDLSVLIEKEGIIRSIGLQRAWKLFFVMALAGHWCCCGFYFVAKMEAIYGDDLTWAEDLDLFKYIQGGGIEMNTSVSEAYIQALYWAYITMITTGFGDIVPLSLNETLWCIFTMALGVMITACAIANLQLVVTNVDAAHTNFQRKLETVSKYMRYRRLPSDIQNRVTSFYHYQWDLLRGADEEKFLNELPKSLQQQVSNFMCRDLIASLPLLRNANTALLNALADSVEVNIFSPNDEIIKPGEQIQGALLVSRGEVEVLKKGKIERKMKRGDTFAEENLFLKRTCDKTVRAKTFSEIFMLPSDSFQQIVEGQCDKDHIQQMKDTAVTISKNASKANKMFGSGEDAIPLTGTRKRFHPNSLFRVVWDFVCLLGYLYYIFSLPLMVMKYLDGEPYGRNLPMFVLSYTIDLFFIINLYFRFNCFMYFEEGLVIFDIERIRQHFVKDQSVTQEVLASIPFDFLGIFIGARICFLCRMTKILRLRHIVNNIDDLIRHMSGLSFGGNMVFFKVITLNCVLLVVCHWVGTMWHGCADLASGYSQNWRQSDEEDVSLSIDHSDLGGFSSYLRSVYWAIVAMSTVGYGDITPTNPLETKFATVVVLFGGLILPAVVGGLAAYLGNINLTKKNYKRKLHEAKSYMIQSSMDRAILNEVVSYYDYLWSRQNAIDEESILDELPWPLRQQVGVFLHHSQIESVPFFATCEAAVKELIVSILKPRVFMPLDNVIQKGEIGTNMFFIKKGKVAIVAENDLAYCILEHGDYFGESSLISSAVLSTSAKALTYCDVFVLQKEDFQGVMEEFVSPETQNEINKIMVDTMNRKMSTNRKISENLIERPKCASLVSMIEIIRINEKDLRIQDTKGDKAPFYPDSRFRLAWNSLIVLVCTFNAWMIPFRLAFTTRGPVVIDWIFDCILLIDMYLNYCKFVFLLEGEFVDDIERVKSRYVENHLKLDLFSIFPYDTICYFISPVEENGILMASLRVSRLLRVARLPQLLSEIFDVLEDMDISFASLKLVEFLTGVIIIAHWAACGFYVFARLKNDESVCEGLDDSQVIISWANEITECYWRNTWIQRQIINGKIPHDGGQVWERYIRSFNWALPTLVVVVIGDVVPVTSHETLYAFIWMILGVTINAAIIGNVANIVANIDTESSIFAKRADEIKKYMHESHVSKELQSRVDFFLTSLWEHKESLSENLFVSGLPSTLQMKVTQTTRQRHISECPFFDFCSQEIVKALSIRLKLLLFSKGDVIVHHGDMGREMFFLEHGVVDIMSHDGQTVFATLRANSDSVAWRNKESAFFGETSLFFKKRRSNTVRAASFCEVYQLHKSDLDRELRQRDFNLSRMLQVFTNIADSNKMRNAAVDANLKLAILEESKLYHLLGPNPTNYEQTKKFKAFLAPTSSFRQIWEFACAGFTIYLIFTVPFRAVFHYRPITSPLQSSFVLDFVIDLFFVIDFYFRARLFPVMKNGSLLMEKEVIWKQFKDDGMIFDFIACVPTEILAFRFGTQTLLLFRLTHLIRIAKIPKYFEQIERYFNGYNFRIDAAMRLLLKMMFYYVLVNHWCACIWFAIHRFFEASIKYTWATTDCPDGDLQASPASGCLSAWIEENNMHNICDGDRIQRCYIRSLYFVLTTLSTVGYGDISPVTALETVFQNIVVLIGACFLAGLIGSFAEYLSHNDESGQSAFETKIQKLQDYMKYRNLPFSLQHEILFFHRHKWTNSHVLDERSVLSVLPIPLQMELSYELLKPMIFLFPILCEAEIVVQKRISHALTRQVCPSNATIYNAGDIGWDVYFIGAGLIKISLPSNLDILDEEGKANMSHTKDKAESVGLLYRPGNHFGEYCLKSQSGVRQETVIAKTMTTLYLISKESLDNVLNFMTKEQRDKLVSNLLSRNGNVWHSFDSVLDSPQKKSSKIRMQPTRSPSYILNKSERFTVLQAQRSRKKLLSGSRQSTRRRSTRLRSFSAEASAQAIRNKLSRDYSTSFPKLRKTNEISEKSQTVQTRSKSTRIRQFGLDTYDYDSDDTSTSDRDFCCMRKETQQTPEGISKSTQH